MNSERLFLKISILGILIAIILGAFGAHALKDIFSNYELDIWNKGVFYQIINSLGLLSFVILKKINIIQKPPFLLLTIGILLFSFSLYSIAMTNVFLDPDHFIKSFLIPATPIGGSLLVLSWLLLLFKIEI
jgi:uncharacterized membrane protein YgdD (TMEM256/DUF423 family)